MQNWYKKLSIAGITIVILALIFYTVFLFKNQSEGKVKITKIYFADHISPAHEELIRKFNIAYENKIEVIPINLPFSKFTTNERKELLARALRGKSDRIDIFSVDLIWIPLSKSVKRIHVAGKNVDDLGNQCGGWTISWQGSSGNITVGTTILEAVQNTVSPTTEITYSLDGSGAGGSDVGIVVIGETPYAEGQGDRSDLALSSEDVSAIRTVKNSGIPVVVILVSGRPLILSSILDSSDAIVAAWLPGTEGQGVVDVLFGDVNPVGKLSHSWPRDMSQIPINYGDNDYEPLFPYGFDLTYE
jgi:beta-glucosidase